MSSRRQIEVVVGPAKCGKTTAALARYVEFLSAASAAATPQVRWIAPTRAAAEDIRDAVARGLSRPILNPGIGTFVDLAGAILRDAGSRARAVSSLQRRRIIHRVIQETAAEGRLAYFGAAADSPGLVELVDAAIADLKRRDVWAEAYRAQARGRGDRERDLAELYGRYQARLTAAELFDAEGLFWAARAEMKQRPQLLGGLKLVVVDGFSDFTGAQQELLKLLAARSEEIVVTLPGDGPADDGRSELFAKPRRTLALLQPSNRSLTRDATQAFPALDYLEGNLFRNLREVEPLTSAIVASADRIHVLAASSAQGEIEEIARRVKRLLLAGAAPGEIVVAFRSTAELADRVRAAFADFGIPALIDAPRRLSAAPIVRTLTALLTLAADDWPHRVLLRVVGDRSIPLFDAAADTDDESGESANPRAAAERAVREAQLPRGREALLAQLAEWAEGDPAEVAGAARGRLATPAFSRLAETLGKLPSKAPLEGWIAAARTLIAELDLIPAGAPGSSADAAWQALARSLRSDAQADAWIGHARQSLSLREFLELFESCADEAPLPDRNDAVGRVRVLGAEAARHAHAKHLFVGNLAEQSFPRPGAAASAETGVAGVESASPQDERLRPGGGEKADPSHPGSGNAGEGASTPHSDEMLLFYQLVTRPSESLTLSYPALDSRAQAMPPSPFLGELERLFADAPIERTPQPLGYAAQLANPPLSGAELRRRSVIDALDTSSESRERRTLLASLAGAPQTAPVGHSILNGVEAVASRGRRNEFGPFEGILTSDAAKADLRQTFGAEHLWSPSQLEHYAACPFKFFAEHVLRLRPTPELALESDVLRRGTLLHETLARLYSQHGHEFGGDTASALDPAASEKLVGRFREVLGDLAGARPGRGLDEALREIERRQIESWAAEFAQQHGRYEASHQGFDERPTPRYFEARFGRVARGASTSDADVSTDEHYSLKLASGSIRLSGQIDRIDVGRVGETTVFNVVDYKAGRTAKVDLEKVKAGLQLQLALYVMATAELLLAKQQAVPFNAGYWSVQGKGYGAGKNLVIPFHVIREGVLEATEEWPPLQTDLLARIDQLVAGIRGGEFPVASVDEQCTRYCEFAKVCRIAQVRSLEKTWEPAAAGAGTARLADGEEAAK